MRQRRTAGNMLAATAIVLGGIGAHPLALAHSTGGAIVRTIALHTPYQIVVATRARRVFVTALGATTARGQFLGQGRVAMLDARTGALLRMIPLAWPAGPLAVDERTSRVFVGAQGAVGSHGQKQGQATLITLDARTGAVVRTTRVGPHFQAMVVDEETNRVFVAGDGDFTTRTPGALSVLDARTGALVRRLPLGHDPTALTLDTRTGHVFVAYQEIVESYYWSSRLTLLMVDARTGAQLRATPLASSRYLTAAGLAQHAGRLFLSLQARLDTVVALVDTRTGRVLRTVPTGAAVQAMVVDDTRSRVFIANNRQDLHAYPNNSALTVLDAHTGALLRTVDLHRASTALLLLNTRTGRVVLVSSGIVNVSEHFDTTRASLMLLDAYTGAFVRAVAWPWANVTDALVEPHSGHLLVPQPPALGRTSAPPTVGMVAVLDGRTGRVLRTIRAGYYPSAMMLDAVTNRLFVLDAGPPDRQLRPAGKGGVVVLDATIAMGGSALAGS